MGKDDKVCMCTTNDWIKWSRTILDAINSKFTDRFGVKIYRPLSTLYQFTNHFKKRGGVTPPAQYTPDYSLF